MSSSDDDLPLARRAQMVVNLDSDTDTPSWIVGHQARVAAQGPSSSSDSDVREVTQPQNQAAAQAQAEGPGEAPLPAAPPTQQQQQQQQGAPQDKGAAAAVAAEPAGPEVPSSQQPASQKPTPLKRGAGGTGAPTNTMPVMLPEKLPQMKILVELESVEGGATDLAGDTGAVGRMLVTGAPGSQQVQIDLKGVLYSATVVPCPATMAVVNVGQSEAKVECLFTEFLQLREDTRFSCHNAGGGALDTLLGDEDQEDNYMVTAGGANEGGGEEGGKKGAAGGKKGGAKAAAGSKGGKGGKGAGAARGLKKTVGGGVKKAKAGAGGKGKGKGAKPKAGGGAKAAKAKPKAKAGGVKKAAGKGK